MISIEGGNLRDAVFRRVKRAAAGDSVDSRIYQRQALVVVIEFFEACECLRLRFDENTSNVHVLNYRPQVIDGDTIIGADLKER
jgi:hypothetical protein